MASQIFSTMILRGALGLSRAWSLQRHGGLWLGRSLRHASTNLHPAHPEATLAGMEMFEEDHSSIIMKQTLGVWGGYEAVRETLIGLMDNYI